VRLKGLGQLKNPVTSGVELATFRLVAQCLNQLCYRVPGACLHPNVGLDVLTLPRMESIIVFPVTAVLIYFYVLTKTAHFETPSIYLCFAFGLRAGYLG
jgi:hypothetical protein